MASSSGCWDNIAASRRISSHTRGSRSLRRSRASVLPGGAGPGASFFPVSGRQDLARGQDFNADDMPFGIDIVNEGAGLFRPLDLAVPNYDVHGIGFSIVGYVGHGFRLAFRSSITLIRLLCMGLFSIFLLCGHGSLRPDPISSCVGG